MDDPKCYICGFQRSNKYVVIRHIKQHLTNANKKTREKINKEVELLKKHRSDKNACPDCLQSFTTPLSLNIHVKKGICLSKDKKSRINIDTIMSFIDEKVNNINELERLNFFVSMKLKKIRQTKKKIDITKRVTNKTMTMTPEEKESYRCSYVGNNESLVKLDEIIESKSTPKTRSFGEESFDILEENPEDTMVFILKFVDITQYFSLFSRLFQTIYLNPYYPENNNIVVCSDKFGDAVKIFRNEWKHTYSQYIFENKLILHLINIILSAARTLMDEEYVVEQQLLNDDDEPERECRLEITRDKYNALKNNLMYFFDKDKEVMYKLSRHLYYLCYEFWHFRDSPINSDDKISLPVSNGYVQLKKPEESYHDDVFTRYSSHLVLEETAIEDLGIDKQIDKTVSNEKDNNTPKKDILKTYEEI